jgi:hypothetical protein
VVEEAYGIFRLISESVGKLGAIPGALMIDPWNMERFVTTPSIDEVKARFHEMSRLHPKELQNVTINIGGSRLIEDFNRIIYDKSIPFIDKILYVVDIPNELIAMLMRSNYYDPFTNTVCIYSRSPGILEHELGHAVDMNHDPSRANVYILNLVAPIIERVTGLPIVKPLSLFHEFKASQYAINAAKTPEERAARWSTLAPAFGTYFSITAYTIAHFLRYRFLPQGLVCSVLGALAGQAVAKVRNSLGEVWR